MPGHQSCFNAGTLYSESASDVTTVQIAFLRAAIEMIKVSWSRKRREVRPDGVILVILMDKNQ